MSQLLASSAPEALPRAPWELPNLDQHIYEPVCSGHYSICLGKGIFIGH